MHAAEHAAFKRRLKSLEERLTLEDPSEMLAAHTQAFLTNWLITHVTNLDKELTGYINEARTKQWEKWLVSQF
jgi:hemerythrin